MNKIAITGTFATGKTMVSLILSHLTGFQHLMPQTDFETERILKLSSENKDTFYSNFMACIYKLSDRLRNEALAVNNFISDGCLLNEIAYLKAFHEVMFQQSVSSKKFKEQQLMIESIENTVNYFFNQRYDHLILLSFDPKTSPNQFPVNPTIRLRYNDYLVAMMQNVGQVYKTYLIQDLEQSINQIAKEINLECKISAREAIFRAHTNLHQVNTQLNKIEFN